MPRLGELYPGICLTTEEKARKNLSQGSRRVLVYVLPKRTRYKTHTYTHPHITKPTHTHPHLTEPTHTHPHITKPTHLHPHLTKPTHYKNLVTHSSGRLHTCFPLNCCQTQKVRSTCYQAHHTIHSLKISFGSWLHVSHVDFRGTTYAHFVNYLYRPG